MNVEVTRLLIGDNTFDVWNINLLSSQTTPPVFFMTADTDLRVTLYGPLDELPSNQKNKLVPRIASLKMVTGVNLNEIQVEDLSRLTCLEIRPGRHAKNLELLLRQNFQSMQEMALDLGVGQFKIFTKLTCNFNKLTKLKLSFGCSRRDIAQKYEDDWFGFVCLVNNCPNLQDLGVFNIQANEVLIAKHPLKKHDKVQKLSLVIDRSKFETAGYFHIINTFKDSVQHLRVGIHSVMEEFWSSEWFLPHVTKVDLKHEWYPYSDRSLESVKPHFPENVDINTRIRF